ncbi:hypothetical protein D3C87_300740 [compost metagenome]
MTSTWGKMKMTKLILGLCLVSSFASAAQLEDVKILSATPQEQSLKLKLQTKGGSKDSYFFVDIMKNDTESFNKLVHVINKMANKERYKLNIDIPSFSASPSGSYYRSNGLTFSGVEKK